MTRYADADVAAAWQCASLMLDYPGSQDLSVVRSALPHLPGSLREPLQATLAHQDRAPLPARQADYVATFDSQRRCNLYLSYFAYGDTRKRGSALLGFQQVYRAAGVPFVADELPDHLCVVLEFAATVDLAAGRQLILDHRAGVELLRIALREDQSPWAPLLEVVCRPLPPLRGEEETAVRRLVEEGPPEEQVGLTPYGAPTGPVDLPMPSVAGRGR